MKNRAGTPDNSAEPSSGTNAGAATAQPPEPESPRIGQCFMNIGIHENGPYLYILCRMNYGIRSRKRQMKTYLNVHSKKVVDNPMEMAKELAESNLINKVILSLIFKKSLIAN